ncbi:MAG: histidine kinase [Frankiales bacterium]|nr:histidine kinase [Frankiales bacterium]
MTGHSLDPFHGGGQVGDDLAAVDWASTALGHPDTWPQSLIAVVRVLLSSRFAMWMAWGPDLTFFCNDAYRRDTLGKKYPWALGKPAAEVWAEIWPDVGPRIEHVMSTGEATWDEALLLFLERSGFKEESYHTFSYSPLAGDDGSIAGMLCVVSEDTERVIGARQMATLRDLGSEATSLRSEADLLAAMARHLADNPWSLPFTLTYLLDGPRSARLVCSTGLPEHHPAAPAQLDLGAGDSPWAAAALSEAGPIVVDATDPRVPALPAGPWDTPPSQVLVVPFRQQGQSLPDGFLVAGLNPFRPVDDDYFGFVELVAGQLASGIASARAYETERHRAQELAELDRAKTAFFTNVSHEFRTPLTLLLGPAEDALQDKAHPLPAPQRTRVELIERNAQRLLKLVNTLLDFSRLEAGDLPAQFEPVDLARYTAELAAAFAPATDRVGLSLTVECPPLAEPVWVDREMWAKVVLNLLSNALKFTFGGGITLRLLQEGDAGAVRLEVTDSGIGIAPSEQERLFERFRRVTGSQSRSYEGSGIGLALVAELAKVHGGSVAVESAPGQGSTFVVRLPLGSAHLPADQLVTTPGVSSVDAKARATGFLAEAMRWTGLDGAATPAASGSGEHERPRVLVVDDSADMRDYVSRLLAVEYDVEAAEDGAKGLAAALAQPPDLVLTDLMMPNLDGFQLLGALRAEPATAHIPVVMLSARAGEEATIEALEAGADDYLIKPFGARELLARVRANLELDRVRQTRAQLEHSQRLLDQAQRLARVGSWELDLATGALIGSPEFHRQLQMDADELAHHGLETAFARRVHPDDVDRVRTTLASATAGRPLAYEVRLVGPDGEMRTYRSLGELELDEQGAPMRIRGSNQDITEQRQAEEALAAAAAEQRAAAREHQIADELQRSLLPERSFDPDHLRVATYYQAGVEGTQVGGDWYDVIDLGAGRTALVLGDVMGRGVRAAAVMGQLRSAVRAYARLDLPPADVLEFLDAVVRDLGEDQIVTCIYAVYDPGERSISYANAGHLPPLLRLPGEPARRLTGAQGPPLGTGIPPLAEEQVALPSGAVLVLYTDGLVEHPGTDLDEGIDALTVEVDKLAEIMDEHAPERFVRALLPTGPDDDVAVLVAQVDEQAQHARTASKQISVEERSVQSSRRFAGETLRAWSMPDALVDDVVLLTSELVTNALLHGQAPVEMRLREGVDHVVLEVEDHATYLPRRMRPSGDDEHGRGLQLVTLLADRWGTRPTSHGKTVWCLFTLPEESRRTTGR